MVPLASGPTFLPGGCREGPGHLPGRSGAPQVWQCGGSMEVLPCSRVAHIERTKKPYNNDIDNMPAQRPARQPGCGWAGFKSTCTWPGYIPMTVSWPSWAGRARGQGNTWGRPQGHPRSTAGQLHLRNIVPFTREPVSNSCDAAGIRQPRHHHRSSFTRYYEPLRGCSGGSEERAPRAATAPPGTHKHPPCPAEASRVSSAEVHSDTMTPCLAHTRVCTADEWQSRHVTVLHRTLS